MTRFRRLLMLSVALVPLSGVPVPGAGQARAQAPAGPPPAVGVVQAKKVPITQTSEFVGRIQAINRVALVSRVTAFLEQRLFTEGSEVHKGDLLYKLEQPPFQAAVESAQGAVGQQQAQLQNATITLGRAQSLLNTPAGQRSTVDDATASQRSYAAQVLSAQAQLQQAQINLNYTEIKAPIDGRISATAVTEGNVVSPSSGTLATLVSQDPEYVVFPVALRDLLDLRTKYATRGGYDAVVIKLRLPNGEIYGQTGRLDYSSPTVSTTTDTVTLRADIANPSLPNAAIGKTKLHELVDGEFVTVLVEGAQPVEVLQIPRSAVLSDQQGDYVYVVGADNKAQQARVQLGQSDGTNASVMSGLAEGQSVVVDGVQRVHAGQAVSPGPAAAPAPTGSALPAASGAPGAGSTKAPAVSPESGAAVTVPGAAAPGSGAAGGATQTGPAPGPGGSAPAGQASGGGVGVSNPTSGAGAGGGH